ncbi:DUF6922 domain-containing protein [Ammonifex thiophilus]|uniref:DUF6922 domain-containing protein n=1 Tax=Ammonifex thiophilus TaxID=444093 RepID=A0A3D8P4P6_9THEO|nr:hypothetical protein [Ammonifex thiophilus]RDV82330.1 hypothetical protein DXX99_07920 [Ammonifex thiophilus]
MAPVPERFRTIFWDVRPGDLDVREHKKFIIERVLEFGDEDAYRWMFATYTDEEIVEVAKASRRISPRTATMLANFYKVPEEEFACLRNASRPRP